MNAPDPPAVPDPAKTAAAQSVANKETAVAQYGLNATNQVTPQGTLNYSQIGKWEDGTPRFQAEQTLSPANQALLTQNQKTQQGLSTLAGDQTARISEHLANPVTAEGLPAGGTTPAKAPGLMGNYGVERASGSIGDAGAIQTSVPQQNRSGTIQDAGPLSRTLTQQNQSGQIADVGGVNRSVPLANQSGQVADVGGLTRSVAQANQSGEIADVGGLQRAVPLQNQSQTFGPTSTGVQTNYGPTDYSSDRTKVEDALMSRINPRLEEDRNREMTRLINSGVRPGTVAWDRAQQNAGKTATDARMQAILAGGTEQSRLAGLARDAGTFTNTAQAQEFAQQLQRGMFSNTATDANNAARLNEARFGNEAQTTAFGQADTRTQRADAATAANNAARLREAEFGNTAQQAAFNQAGTRTSMSDAAVAANNDSRVREAQFGNDAQRQALQEAALRTSTSDAATQANNAAREREATFANTTQGQQFAQNQATQAAEAAAIEANNAARMREATFGRESQGLQFTQNQARQQAADAAALANTEANRTATGFANTTGQQTFTNEQSIAAAQNAERERALKERLTFRNQPINEITALLSGSQVSQPQFATTPTPGVAPTDLIGATANATNAQMQAYAQQQANSRAMMSGLFGLGSAAIGAV